MTLNVGNQQQPSTADIGDGHSITALPGQDASNGDGGDGYSGGGGFGDRSHGGSDGGDGDDGSLGSGGSGTGEDISQYVFDAWTLSPGSGGVPDTGCAPYDCAGGGGGVLVDGAGPEASRYQGQGYGGGGVGGYHAGLQGIILIEATSSP